MAKSLTAAELRGYSVKELTEKLKEAKEELFNLRFQAATGQLDNNSRLRIVKREIARMSEKTTAQERNHRKVREGYVVSDKMDKTVVVAVENRFKHPLYGKIIRRTTKYKAHDEANIAGVGDRVRLMETRPLSATKRCRVVEILEKAK